MTDRTDQHNLFMDGGSLQSMLAAAFAAEMKSWGIDIDAADWAVVNDAARSTVPVLIRDLGFELIALAKMFDAWQDDWVKRAEIANDDD